MSNNRRNSIVSIDSIASFYEEDSEYEPSVTSECEYEDEERDWNEACLDDEVIARHWNGVCLDDDDEGVVTGVIKGSDTVATGTRSKTNIVETGTRRSERIRNQIAHKIIFANGGPRLRIRNTTRK